jgi:hypothetical protein
MHTARHTIFAMSGTSADYIECTAEQRLRELALERVAKLYAKDARADSRRAFRFFTLAALLTGGGGVLGAVQMAIDQSTTRQAVATAGVLMVSSLPIWWAADRYRRTSNESRRLERQTNSVECYLAGFAEPDRTLMRASLAQRLFSRPEESDRLIGEPTWPSASDLRLRAK